MDDLKKLPASTEAGVEPMGLDETTKEVLLEELRAIREMFPEADRLIRNLMASRRDRGGDAKIQEIKQRLLDAELDLERARGENTRLMRVNSRLMDRMDPRSEMMAAALKRSHVATLILDGAQGKVVCANAAAENLLGNAVGVHVFPLLLETLRPYVQDPRDEDSLNRKMPEHFGTRLWNGLRGSETFVVDERVLMEAYGRGGHVDVLLRMENFRDVNDHPWVHVEIVEIERHNRDSMTGLYRREVAVNAMRRELEHRRSGQIDRRGGAEPYPVSVIMMDVDDFKRYNTLYGYAGGDKVIEKVAKAVSRETRARDLACRWFSGDEFLVFVYGGAEVVQGVAERIASSIGDLVVRLTDGSGTRTVERVGVSVGVATSVPGDDWKSLVDRAIHGLDEAKRLGKGRISTTVSRVSG